MNDKDIDIWKEKTKGIFHITEYRRFWDYITNLQEELKVSQINEEIYRLEMQDITKILGLDEHTIFDEVKEYATNLQKEVEDLREDNYAYHQLMKIQNKREYRSKFLKEFQEEFGTNTFPDYDEIYKRYDKVKKENERLKELCDKYEEEHSTTFNEWKETITDKCQALKDLQEEVEDLRRIFGIWNNRKLIKKFNKEYDKEDKNKNPNRDYVAIYPDAEEVYKRYYDYKSRNEKAIEYIKNYKNDYAPYELSDYNIRELLNILNGGDEE